MATSSTNPDDPNDNANQSEQLNNEQSSAGSSRRAVLDWRSLHLWQIQPIRDVLVVCAVLGLFWLGQKISVVTVPLLLAILLAYLFEPVIAWLMSKTRITRQRAVTSVLAAAILIIIVPAAIGLTFGVAQSIGLVKHLANNISTTYSAVETGRQLQSAQQAYDALETGPNDTADSVTLLPSSTDSSVSEPAPSSAPAAQPVTKPAQPITEAQAKALGKRKKLEAEYTQKLDQVEIECGSAYRHFAEYLSSHADDSTISNAFETIRQWLSTNAQSLATAGAGALRSTLGFLGSLFGLGFMGFITAFFFFFIATGWVQFKGFTRSLLPDKNREHILHLSSKFDAVISGFIRGRLTIAFLQAIVFTIGYIIIGVPAAFILGPAVAILSIVPYLALVGVPISIILLALEGHTGFRGQWAWILLAPTVFYFIGQALDDYIWTPKIQGKSTDMSTPMILFASLAGGVLFGVFGLLIAIPLAACLKIVLEEIFWPRFKAWAEGREKDFLPLD